MLYIFVVSFILFLILNLLDAHSTFEIVSRIGHHAERNPVARYFIKTFGIKKGIIYLKMIIIFLVPFIIWSYTISSKEITVLLIGINIVYLIVVINNYMILKKITN